MNRLSLTCLPVNRLHLIVLVLFLVLLLPACGGDDDTEDGDTDGDQIADGDNNTDGDNEPDGDNSVDGDTNTDGDGELPPAYDENRPLFGELIFTELMYDSLAVSDDDGEWVELLNIGQRTVTLTGCTFEDSKSDHRTLITGSLDVAAGDYLIFGIVRSIELTDDVDPDWEWGTYNLSNSSDGVVLMCNDQLVDQVFYDEETMAVTPVKGASLSLCAGKEDPNDNDDMANWFYSTTAMTNGDFGTPRAVNESCP